MGLVSKTYTVHVPTKVHTDGSSSSPVEEVKSFDMTIYRAMSSTENMKTLEIPERITDEFDIFLQMAEAKQNGEVNTDFDAMDVYLGSFTDPDLVIPTETFRNVVYNTTNNVVDNGLQVIHLPGA